MGAPAGFIGWKSMGRSAMAGAAAFLFVNHYPGYGPATGSIGHNDAEGIIPAFSVSYEDGAYLKRLLRRHGEVRLRLHSTDRCEPMVSWNVIGDWPGQRTDAVVMLGCHYDGHDISQGAGDPRFRGCFQSWKSLGFWLNMPRILPCTVRFALWGIEELGLLGSSRLCSTACG